METKITQMSTIIKHRQKYQTFWETAVAAAGAEASGCTVDAGCTVDDAPKGTNEFKDCVGVICRAERGSDGPFTTGRTSSEGVSSDSSSLASTSI